jgi:prepilin-type N-terminal cleavage/methylation domain-containing protein
MKILAARRPLFPRRGSSLIEVLVALAILSIMMAGILQLFSLALLASAGSAARTELIFRCQQVVENVRLCYYLYSQDSTLLVPLGAGVPSPIATGTYNLPYKSTDAGWATGFAFWGPDGANVITESGGPYKLSYTITSVPLLTTPPPAAMWTITVSAIPTDDPTAARRFFGVRLQNYKRVDYVASFPF